jgi:hypothetical protein
MFWRYACNVTGSLRSVSLTGTHLWSSPGISSHQFVDELSIINLADAAAFRSIVGHYVAGTEGLEELRAAIRDALSCIGHSK